MNTQTIGVIGMGLLGRGITGCLLAHGMRVVAFDRSAHELASARMEIARAIEELISHGITSPALRDEWAQNLVEARSLSDLAHCDFLIESITESLESKTALYVLLEEILAPETIIASNTSALPISTLQHGLKNPERLVGMHWAEPAHATRFLELIRGEATSDATLQAAFDLALRLGKDPCIVRQDIPGFLANRLGYALYREACHLLATGVADAETIDRSFRNSFGLWAGVCGPLRWIDLTGGPALYGKAMAGVLPTLSNATTVPEPLATMMHEGLSGARGGLGFHSYTEEEAQRWEKIYRDQVWRMHAVAEEVFPIPTSEVPER
jgi:3-hydroxybutyryl-CoA dehydrogenase